MIKRARLGWVSVVVQLWSHVSLQPHRVQCSQLPCPSVSPGVAQIHVIGLVMLSNCLILCRPLFSACSPSFPASRVFSNELTLHIRWPEYWSFSISPSTEYSGLISFRIDSFDLLVWISLEMPPVLHRVEDLVWVTDGGIFRQVQLREGCPSGVPSVSLACWQVQIVPLAGAQLTV